MSVAEFGDGRLPQRFWDKVQREPNGCWRWIATISQRGYGQVRSNYRLYSSHRLAYTSLVAPIPTGLDIDHLCRNRACCNPAHLEAVTRSVNLRRGLGPGLAAIRSRLRGVATTHCKRGHEFTENNTRRQIQIAGNVTRSCRICNANSSRLRRQQRKQEQLNGK